MSYRALFEGILSRFKRRRWGARIQQQDTGVQAFAEELVNALASDAPITINQPIRIKRSYVGPVFLILDDDANAIEYLAADGTQSPNVDLLTKSATCFDTLTVAESVSALRT